MLIIRQQEVGKLDVLMYMSNDQMWTWCQHVFK